LTIGKEVDIRISTRKYIMEKHRKAGNLTYKDVIENNY